MQLGRVHHPRQFVRPAKVAKIDAYSLRPVFQGGNCQPRIKMNVGNQRNRDLLADGTKSLRCLHVRHSHPDDLAARFLQPLDLADRGLGITGVGVGHGLHRDRRATANWSLADENLFGLFALDHGSKLLAKQQLDYGRQSRFIRSAA